MIIIFKKSILIFLILMLTFTVGCGTPREYYNEKDENDFTSGYTTKFEIIQLKNIIDEQLLIKNNLNSSTFLFMSSENFESTYKNVLNSTYYGYLKNKDGGIYFAEIPASNVRIYEDADDGVPYIVGNSYKELNKNYESRWDYYHMFNLHIPKGTIIPRLNLNYDDFLK